MNIYRLKTFPFVALVGLAAGSCSANIHDNTATVNIPNAVVSVTTDADVNNIAPGQQVPVMLTVEHVYLIEPSVTPPPEHVADAGHVQVYLDDFSMSPLLITAQATFNVTVPTDTKAGKHKLLCRLHKHDGTPTTMTTEISIVVKVSETVGDASVTVEIDATTGAGATGSGGATGAGGATGPADTTGAGGATGPGGATALGGATGPGGATGVGGAAGPGGATGLGGAGGV